MYGGTKTEMERLVTDAEKLNKKFKATRDENGKVALTFADIVDAIHIVQQDLGITGTSAEEASTTITGSLGSVKASWKDLLTAMGRGSGIDKSLDNFTQSVKKFGGNIKPTLETSLKSLVTVVSDIAPSIAEELPKLVIEITPTLFKAGADIVGAIGTGVYNTLVESNFDETAKTLTNKVNDIIGQLDAEKSGEKFSGVLNKVINAGFNISSEFDFKDAAKKLTDWSNSAIKNLDVAKLGQTVSNAWKGVWDFIGTALGNVDWENVGNKISEFINNVDWNGILDSLFKAIGEILKAAPELLLSVIRNLDWENASGLIAMLFAPKIASNLLSAFKSNPGVTSTLGQTGGAIGNGIAGAEGGTGLLATATGTATKFIGALGAGIKAFAGGYAFGSLIYNTFKGVIDPIMESVYDATIGPFLLKLSGAQKEAEQAKKNWDKLTRERLTPTAQKYIDMGYKIDTSSIDAYNKSIAEARRQEQLKQAQQKAAKANYTTVRTTINSAYDAAAHKAAETTNYNNNASFYKPGSSAATAIYLDTNKLVGGTSSAYSTQSATSYNYAKKGYA